MKIKTWIKYEEGYIPPKCRKIRYRECEEHIDVNLKEVGMDSLQLAFEDISYNGAGKIYLYKKKLWSKVRSGAFVCNPYDRGLNSPLDELVHRNAKCSWYFPRSWRDGEHPDKKKMESAARKDMRNYILVNGELFTRTNEPRYCVCTFGLGNNHGGTGLFVDYHYNQNIRKECYFSSLDGKKAVEFANKTAEERGDTNDVGRFKELIKVYMPEIVRL